MDNDDNNHSLNTKLGNKIPSKRSLACSRCGWPTWGALPMEAARHSGAAARQACAESRAASSEGAVMPTVVASCRLAVSAAASLAAASHSDAARLLHAQTHWPVHRYKRQSDCPSAV